MAKLSVAKFASSLEYPITRQRMNELVNRGDVIRGKDKKIDTEHPTNKAWIATRSLAPPPATGKPIHMPQAPHQRPLAPLEAGNRAPDAGIPLSDAILDGSSDFDADDMLDQVAGLNFATLTKVQVDKIHKLEALLKVRVERQHKRRELIERSLVQTVFSKLYMVDTNELKTLGAKLSPVVSGMLGIEDPEIVMAVEQIIDTEVMKSLSHIQRIMDDFLVAQEAVGGLVAGTVESMAI